VSPELIASIVMGVVSQLVAAAAIWGGIRADIKGMHVRLSSLEERFNRFADANITDHGWNRRAGDAK
jgi:hypothetical protein